MKKKAFVTGISGQDGSYLAELLLEKDYEVYGIVRRHSHAQGQNIRFAHIKDNLNVDYGDLLDQSSLYRTLASVKPDEIYNLAAQSHVRVSYDVPQYTMQTNVVGTLNLLEATRHCCPNAKFYQASSSEMFGNCIDEDGFQRETTPMKPVSPYGCSKLASYCINRNYRNSYNLFASNGILFNHESPRRGFEFVTRKISYAVARIKKGFQKKLQLGNIKSKRDWGHAKDYVNAMWLMLQQENSGDYVIGTGIQHTVEEFAKRAFAHVGLNYKDYVVIDQRLVRPAEVDTLLADYAKAKKILNWTPKTSFEDLVANMVENDLKNVNE